MNVLCLAIAISLVINFTQDKPTLPKKVAQAPPLTALQLKELATLHKELGKLVHSDDKCKALLEAQAKKQLGLWKQAAESGHVQGQVIMGACYALGAAMKRSDHPVSPGS